MVDQWKRQVHEETKGLTLAEKLEYWKRASTEARALGLEVSGSVDIKASRKRRSRKTG